MKHGINDTVMVTGGAGFLGSHLCERLMAGGNSVLCVDNCYTGTKQNVGHLLASDRFEFLRHDVTFPLYVEVSQIYNLACPASPIHYQLDPVQTTKTNVHGAINMLGLAKRVRARILQASTSEVYGDPDVHPQPESYPGRVNPIGVRSCYDEGKRWLRHSFLTITDSMLSISKLSVSSTPTVQECTLTTVASYRISLCRHCAAKTLRFTVKGNRHAVSATLMT